MASRELNQEPRGYPTRRYYADGSSVLVATPEEYAALPPGHSRYPGGPFPPTFEESEAAPGPAPDPRIAAAQALRAQGQTLRQIAGQFGVAESSVRRWLRAPQEEA